MTSTRRPTRDDDLEPAKRPKKVALGPEMLESVQQRLRSGKQVRRTLPGRGRLHVDRELPFLCVYRRPDSPDPGTEKLVTGEASYLVAAGSGPGSSVGALVRTVVEARIDRYGAFLLVEVWAKPDSGAEVDPRAIEVHPVIEVERDPQGPLDATVEVLVRHLGRMKVHRQPVAVELKSRDCPAPPGLKSLVRKRDGDRGIHIIGIAVPPVYRDDARNPPTEFPLVLNALRRRFGLALRRTFYDFMRRRTTYRPPHYHELGRRAVVKAVWEVDEQLAEVSNQFDYLLNVTPINTSGAWKQFRRAKFDRAPQFHYLPLPFDPPLLKRQLYRIPLERIEDPALATLFLEKQEELDRKITMLSDRNTPRFLLGSLQLFGGTSDALNRLAAQVLCDVRVKRRKSRRQRVGAEELARRAKLEMKGYRDVHPGFSATVQVTSNVAGVMVSRGRLLIGNEVTMVEPRVDPLLQHEIGTHLVTYFNGRAQPFRQLYSGLAGYEELQEGLAVLGEYLVGGLSPARMRQLAGRVIAVSELVAGAGFVDTFRTLTLDHGFEHRAAFNIVMRVHRGGGLTKDVIYLRGFENVVNLAQGGSELEELFIGKLAPAHIGIVRELRLRGVLKPPPIRPRFLERPDAIARLASLRDGTRGLADVLPGHGAGPRARES